MSQLKALKQDAKRQVGNKAPIRGKFGELIRLQERIESGELTVDETAREMEQFRDVAYNLAGELEHEGAYEIAEEVDEIGQFGPRDGFNLPDTGFRGFHEAAKKFLG
jgi:hypothetical protein